MVCKKCSKKLGKVICPDVWKSGSRNTQESGGRRLNENKLLSGRNRSNPYSKGSSCRLCKGTIHQKGSKYCQSCAYKKGVCSMCGKMILDTKNYKQSST